MKHWLRLDPPSSIQDNQSGSDFQARDDTYQSRIGVWFHMKSTDLDSGAFNDRFIISNLVTTIVHQGILNTLLLNNIEERVNGESKDPKDTTET